MERKREIRGMVTLAMWIAIILCGIAIAHLPITWAREARKSTKRTADAWLPGAHVLVGKKQNDWEKLVEGLKKEPSRYWMDMSPLGRYRSAFENNEQTVMVTAEGIGYATVQGTHVFSCFVPLGYDHRTGMSIVSVAVRDSEIELEVRSTFWSWLGDVIGLTIFLGVLLGLAIWVVTRSISAIILRLVFGPDQIPWYDQPSPLR